MKRAKVKIARMSPDKSRGQRIRQARIRHPKYATQVSFAKALGVATQTYNRYETRGDLPKRAIVEKMAALLNVTPAWIEHGPQQPAAKPPKRKPLAAIEAYLANELGSDVAEHIAERLRTFDYEETFQGHTVSVKDVHRVREFLEYCASVGRKR